MAVASAQGEANDARSRVNCEEPTRLVQLGTVKEVAAFQDELLAGKRHVYDPETLAESPPLSAKPAPSTKTNRYAEVAGGFGLVVADGMPLVENADTQESVQKPQIPCNAGGTFAYSLSQTGRFLICNSNRSGISVIDLRAPPPKTGFPWTELGEGTFLSPNDEYVVRVPVIDWGTGEPTTQDVVHVDLDSKRSKKIAPAPLQRLHEENPVLPANPYSVAFCADGSIFVASAGREVAVFRGRDGSRLASAPSMKGGTVSFSASGRYVSQTRGNETTIFRLEM